MNRTLMRIHLVLAIALSLAMVGCGGPGVGRVQGEGKVAYGNPGDVETVGTGWGSTDLQMTAERMTQSLLASAVISRASSPPKVRLRQIRNMTDEHIDSKGITDKMRVKLMQSGSVTFLVDTGNLDQVYLERDFTEEETERYYTYLEDTDYIITGTIRSIRKRSGKILDVYYQITLELTDPHRGVIVWADEQEIRKSATRTSVGW